MNKLENIQQFCDEKGIKTKLNSDALVIYLNEEDILLIKDNPYYDFVTLVDGFQFDQHLLPLISAKAEILREMGLKPRRKDVLPTPAKEVIKRTLDFCDSEGSSDLRCDDIIDSFCDCCPFQGSDCVKDFTRKELEEWYNEEI